MTHHHDLSKVKACHTKVFVSLVIYVRAWLKESRDGRKKGEDVDKEMVVQKPGHKANELAVSCPIEDLNRNGGKERAKWNTGQQLRWIKEVGYSRKMDEKPDC